MGTRCDFYLGRGLAAQYLGSIGMDAHTDEMAQYFVGVKDEPGFRAALAKVFGDYGEISATKGWPWPWKDSVTTGNVIAFDAGTVWARHYSNRWTPADDLEHPTDEPCVFADMEAALKATPEGRLCRLLRFQGDFVVGPQEDVLLAVINRAAMLLSKAWLHLFEREGSCWMLDSRWSEERYHLAMLARALRASGDEFDQMLAARRAARGEEGWDLLQWLKSTAAYSEVEMVEREVTADLPVYFGQPCKEAEGRKFRYARVLDTDAFREGRRLLEVVTNTIPSAFGVAVAMELLNLGALPVPRDQTFEWYAQPQKGLGGGSLENTCSTAAGRQRVLKWAAELTFADSDQAGAGA